MAELQAKMAAAPAEVAAMADAIAPGPVVGAAAAAPGAAGSVSVAQTGTCAITWSSTAAVRDVSLTNSCPVYHNGCR